MIRLKTLLIFACLFLTGMASSAQDPLHFEKEVAAMVAGDSAVNKKDVILFTGSSSIRLWKDMKRDFPDRNVLNRGFGGSEMTDLIFYADKLIFPYKPKAIFIYEGDNDLNSGKSPQEILNSAEELLALIRKKLPDGVPVYFITPKPSVARWALKDKYLRYNVLLKAWCSKNKKVVYVDMWAALTDQHGEVLPDIFVEDGLHLNKRGYDIWSAVILRHLK